MCLRLCACVCFRVSVRLSTIKSTPRGKVRNEPRPGTYQNNFLDIRAEEPGTRGRDRPVRFRPPSLALSSATTVSFIPSPSQPGHTAGRDLLCSVRTRIYMEPKKWPFHKIASFLVPYGIESLVSVRYILHYRRDRVFDCIG